MKKLFISMLVFCITLSIFAATPLGTHVKQESPLATVGEQKTAEVKAIWTVKSEDLANMYHYEFGFTNDAITAPEDGSLPTIGDDKWESDQGITLTTAIAGQNKYKGVGQTYVTWAIRTNNKVSITLSTEAMTATPNAATTEGEPTASGNLNWKITISDPETDATTFDSINDAIIDTGTGDNSAKIIIFNTDGTILKTSVGSKKLQLETYATEVDVNTVSYEAIIMMTVTND